MGIVTAMNHTLTSKVVKLKDIMKSLLKEVKKHVVGTVISYQKMNLTKNNFCVALFVETALSIYKSLV